MFIKSFSASVGVVLNMSSLDSFSGLKEKLLLAILERMKEVESHTVKTWFLLWTEGKKCSTCMV